MSQPHSVVSKLTVHRIWGLPTATRIGSFMCLMLLVSTASAQGTQADYDRAARLEAQTRDTVLPSDVRPHWLSGNRRFWYRSNLGGGKRQFVLVDASAGERRTAFDHVRLAAALSTLLKIEITAEQLPFDEIGFDDQLATLRFSVAGKQWQCSLTDYAIKEQETAETKSESLPSLDEPRASRDSGDETSLRFINRLPQTVEIFWIDAEGERRSYAKLKPDEEREQHTYAGHVWLVAAADGKTMGIYEATAVEGRVVIDGTRPRQRGRRARQSRERANGDSPDGQWTAVVKDHNLILRDRKSSKEVPLSNNGKPDDAYSGAAYWSPDSRHVVMLQTQPGDDRQVHVVESSPSDQVQPKLHSFAYLKPGDRIPISKPHLFDIEKQQEITISDSMFPNPWSLDDIRWQPDSKEFRFVYNQRGHQVLRLIGVDAESGQSRTIIDEHQPTFIDYAHKQFRHDLDETGEIIWMSERDGWNHLYLYDARKGAVKNAITRGCYALFPWICSVF